MESELRNPLQTSRHVIRSLKAKYKAKRTLTEKIADWMTSSFGTINFFLINVLFFSVWLTINIGLIPSVNPFDPYPFGLLTTFVSLEAIILAIFVLISQNRAAKIDDLREEIDLQVDMITESELTKLLKLHALLLERQGVDLSKDEELEEMLKPLNESKIEKSLEKQV